MSVRVALFHVRTRRPAVGAQYQSQLDMLNAAAIDAVEGLGWIASLHAAGEEPDPQIRRASQEADLLVILGGDDIEPALYGQPDRRPHRTGYERRADRLQIAVIMDAVVSHRPLLGVCRGMQLLNVALGGTLHQHVEGHRGVGGDHFVATDIPALTAYMPMLKAPTLCTHHQSVDRLGQGLRPALRAQDGTIEAIEHETLPIVGVQWHPEHPRTAQEQFTALLRTTYAQGQTG